MISVLRGLDVSQSDGTKAVRLILAPGWHKQARLSEDYSAVAGVMVLLGLSRENLQMIRF